MNRPLLALFFALSTLQIFGQSIPSGNSNPVADSLKRQLELSTTDAQKVFFLGQLAQLVMSVDKKRSDEYIAQMQKVAELSRDRSLIIDVLLNDARRHYNFSGRQDYVKIGIEKSKKALELAKTSHLEDKEAWAYLYLAQGERANSEFDKALNYNNLALSLASTIDSDSLKVSVHNSIGLTYLRKKDKLLSFRNYLRALELAEAADKYSLMRSCYINLSNFYLDLEEFEKAKDYAFKTLSLTFRFKKTYDRLEVYNNVGTVYAAADQFEMAKEFYDRAIALADTLKFPLLKLNTYGRLVEMYLNNEMSKEAIEVFRSRPELTHFMKNAGFTFYLDNAFGVAYLELRQLDSAFYYLKRAEPEYARQAGRDTQYWFYTNFADYYKLRNDYKTSLSYLLKAKATADNLEDLDIRRDIAQNLDSIYQKLGDYKSAYTYNRLYHVFNDSLQKLSTEKDLMLLEVDNENKRKERRELEEQEVRRNRHNLEYMGVTAAIAGVFIVLVMFGIFSVSAGTIRVLGFFAFIFLFEFIILLADNQIHHWTHGEPLQILAIKIALISVLLPLHHFLEEKVIHYLTSRKKIDLNKTMLAKLTKKDHIEQSEEKSLQSSQDSSS
jgi:tetratricopeptide (TPR) repeat protein